MTLRIAVVGSGIIGLTSAAELLARGHSVEIFTREEVGDTTSMAAGAYWWPHKIFPEARVAIWARDTYEEYRRASRDPATGVHFERHDRFCVDPDDSAYVRHLVDEWEEFDATEIGVECVQAFRLILPVVDVPVYLPWLATDLRDRGARVVRRELSSPRELFPDFSLVVNCTGVQARYFAEDPSVVPIRGQTVRVRRPEGLTGSTRLYRRTDAITLVLPRRDDVVLGGTAEEGNWDRTPNPDETRAILERCGRLVPEVVGAELLGTSVGLRPGRPEVRLELDTSDPARPVVHNYGHGGGGFTVAWGCAREVARIVDSWVATTEPRLVEGW